MIDTHPYAEIAEYLKTHRDKVEQVYRTLGYFDVASHVRRADAPALFSVGLMDTVCPPSTVYAAFNNYAGEKEIREYPFNSHEGGQGFHDREKLAFLAKLVGAAR